MTYSGQLPPELLRAARGATIHEPGIKLAACLIELFRCQLRCAGDPMTADQALARVVNDLRANGVPG
jgi:hypothetical protein